MLIEAPVRTFRFTVVDAVRTVVPVVLLPVVPDAAVVLAVEDVVLTSAEDRACAGAAWALAVGAPRASADSPTRAPRVRVIVLLVMFLPEIRIGVVRTFPTLSKDHGKIKA